MGVITAVETDLARGEASRAWDGVMDRLGILTESHTDDVCVTPVRRIDSVGRAGRTSNWLTPHVK